MPAKTSTIKNKSFAPKARKSSTPTSSSSTSRSRSKSKTPRPPPKQQKTKPGQQTASQPRKKKLRTYTDKELNLPVLNGIVPAGVTKPLGKKKGKVFVDESEEMMTILNLVRAEKDGQIESKMIKMRQLEGIREGRRREMEKREQVKGEKMEELKMAVKKARKRKGEEMEAVLEEKEGKPKSGKKRVSFA